MILSTPILSIIKYSFLGLVVTGAGFLIANTVTIHYKSEEKAEHLAYKTQPLPRNESLSLDRNSLLCLIQPAQPFCQMPSKKRYQLLKNRHFFLPHEDRHSGEENSKISTRPPHPLYLLMRDFVDFAKTLGVRPILLEPSILFCMLSTFQRYSLISNNLHSKVLKRSPDAVTFGVSQKDSRILNQESSIERSSEIGFTFTRFEILQDQSGELMDSGFSFTRQNLTVTVIVFHQRETFLWHSSPKEKGSYPLQFANSHAFENFTGVPFVLEDGQQNGFYLPSEISNFLLQVQRSEFEECWPTTTEETVTSHPTLTLDQLNERALIAIQELKSVLRLRLGTFWLWNETLSGWNDSCSIFQKTSDLNIAIAVPVSLVPKVDLNTIFKDNEYLQVVEHHKWDEFSLQITLDCYGLVIRMTVFYEDLDSKWNYETDSMGNLIRINDPHLRLCSTSVMGQLVHKPCFNQTPS